MRVRLKTSSAVRPGVRISFTISLTKMLVSPSFSITLPGATAEIISVPAGASMVANPAGEPRKRRS